ncbi:MAG: hypothetical protein CYPHOPRED_003222 [Cyphobasidiales sp. Tagirdzhanova-0007]|nr:MAG: hypothetical protein CYPHOPRED_003222 [Cyphobasidiales sp. Tagirdzhanova-0007]
MMKQNIYPTADKDAYLGVSPVSSTDASDNEGELYFSDVSSTSTSSSPSTSSSASASPKLGDFTFASDEEYADYYAVVAAKTDNFSSTSHKPRKSTKTKKTRKGSSAFFLSGASFQSPPTLSPSLALQNPNPRSAAQSLAAKMQELASLSRDHTSRSGDTRSNTLEEEARFERALLFANFTRRDGTWQAPKGTNPSLQMLVEMVA